MRRPSFIELEFAGLLAGYFFGLGSALLALLRWVVA